MRDVAVGILCAFALLICVWGSAVAWAHALYGDEIEKRRRTR